jgi:hypothetical protein
MFGSLPSPGANRGAHLSVVVAATNVAARNCNPPLDVKVGRLARPWSGSVHVLSLRS